jgi:hypothetical protein
MSTDKMIKIAERLLVKTKEGSISWEETEDEYCFQTSLTEYSIRIKGPKMANPFGTSYFIKLLNQKGTELESISDKDAKPGLLEDLYSIARKNALNVDKAIDDILNEIK